MPVRPKIQPAPPPSPFLDAHGAAPFLCVSEQTLAKWRLTGGGPPFSKIGTKIVYDIDDLLMFVNQRKVTSTSQVDYRGKLRGRPSKAHVVERLDREGRTDLAAKVRAGALSVSAAANEAGFRKRSTSRIEGEVLATPESASPESERGLLQAREAYREPHHVVDASVSKDAIANSEQH